MAAGRLYLLNEVGTDRYKIGYTRGSVAKRVKELQTGCAGKINIEVDMHSDSVTELESALHNHYSYYRKMGEWFELPQDVACKFVIVSESFERNIRMLKEQNTYYQDKKK